MEQVDQGVIERLENETIELEKRAGKLERFRETEEFRELEREDQYLLVAQGAQMRALREILSLRLRRMKHKI